jgi:hypothetical protein
LRAVTLQTLVGSDVGVISTAINFANYADFAAGVGAIGADAEWQAFWARAAQAGSAVQVESSLFADIDSGFQPSPDRPMGVIMATQWQARSGRLMDFMGNVMTSIPHVERLGGTTRVLQSLLGAHPMTTLVTTSFADMDAYGAYSDKVTADQEFQQFWAGVMTDPTADLVRTSLMMNISGD